jgi:hypothetical protein
MLFQALLTLVLVYLGWHLLRDPDTAPFQGLPDGQRQEAWAALPQRHPGEAAAQALPWRATVQADLGAVAIRYLEPGDGPAAQGAFAVEDLGRLPRPVIVPR